MSSPTHDLSNLSRQRFDPQHIYLLAIDLEAIEVPRYDDHGNPWTHIACQTEPHCPGCRDLTPHIDSLVIAVDGACRGNGTLGARAAMGVYFGDDSDFNQQRLLSSDDRATNQVAELSAGILALETALDIKHMELLKSPLRQVIIKSDSEYLVKGMTEWMLRWRENGFKTAKGTPITNRYLFLNLIQREKQLRESGVGVRYWYVLRSRNTDADRLANAALDA